MGTTHAEEGGGGFFEGRREQVPATARHREANRAKARPGELTRRDADVVIRQDSVALQILEPRGGHVGALRPVADWRSRDRDVDVDARCGVEGAEDVKATHLGVKEHVLVREPGATIREGSRRLLTGREVPQRDVDLLRVEVVGDGEPGAERLREALVELLLELFSSLLLPMSASSNKYPTNAPKEEGIIESGGATF